MKHLCSLHSQSDAASLASQLESKGIPIVQTNVNSYGMIKSAKMQIDLWVGLESQYQDAVAFMENPEHPISNPVNVAEFHQHLEEFRRKPLLPPGSGARLINIFIGLILASFISWVLWAIVSN